MRLYPGFTRLPVLLHSEMRLHARVPIINLRFLNNVRDRTWLIVQSTLETSTPAISFTMLMFLAPSVRLTYRPIDPMTFM
jgi:hypothetical protein